MNEFVLSLQIEMKVHIISKKKAQKTNKKTSIYVVHLSPLFSPFLFTVVGITDAMDMNLGKFQEMVRGREAWSAAICGVTKSQTRLGD